ncbi:MAG: YdcF family protein [Kiloniellaceae bacterium]
MATAFFFLSKVIWFFVQPLNSLLFLLLAWLASRRLGWRRLAGLCLAVLLLYGGGILLTPLPEAALRILENRFPVPAELPADIAGIIVLGGASDSGAVSKARNQPGLNSAAERLTTAMALHRSLPDKPLIVSGFSGALNPRGWNEAEITERFFVQQGLDMTQVRFEDKSRNTAENARLTAAMVGDGGRPWLLITSARHMPRSVASFRAAGLAVLPYPVDYHTEPAQLVWPRDTGSSLGLAAMALHEWLGLLAYYLSGSSAEILPAPR